MLTAGHCGSGAWKQGGATFGTTSKISFGGRTDEQVLPVTSNAARIFSDPTSTSRRVSSVATSDPIGTLLCTDGYTDREVCNVKVMAIGQVVTYNGATVTGLVQAKQTQGKKAFSPGDSGGPVGATSGSDVIAAYGMIEAYADSTFSLGWYMPARFIQQDMGVKVKTG